MKVSVRWGAAILATLVALGGLAPTAHAQLGAIPARAPLPMAVNPAFNVAPGLQIYSNLYNAAILGRTVRQFPPWAYGFNPYPSPIINSGVGYGTPYIPPYYGGLGTYGPGGYAGAGTLTTNPYGYDSSLYSSNSGYNGYGDGYGYGYMDPAYGFLTGYSNVIRATGDYYKAVQQSRLTQTQADEARFVDYRRKLIEEARYERGLLPTTDELRQQERAQELAYARHEPPITDIITARPLNTLLRHLLNDPGRSKGQDVRIPDGVLDHINVTSPTMPGTGLGLLKDDGKIQRPQSLFGKEFEPAWTDLSRTMESVVTEDLKFAHPAPPGKIMDLNASLQKLNDLVQKSDLSVSDYINAKGYLDQVRAAILALGDPNAASNFNHKFNAKNVAELVDNMKGLDFAPAAPGDEWAYRVLHQALLAYDYSVSSAQGPPPPAAPPYKP
jgi:hypothetical protein